jgi:hypothetical protein
VLAVPTALLAKEEHHRGKCDRDAPEKLGGYDKTDLHSKLPKPAAPFHQDSLWLIMI